MNNEIERFETQADAIKKHSSKKGGGNLTNLMKKRLRETTEAALKSVDETKRVSSFYVNVSSNYLMKNLNAVYEIETHVGKRSKNEVQRMTLELAETCENTIEEINKINCDIVISSSNLPALEAPEAEGDF